MDFPKPDEEAFAKLLHSPHKERASQFLSALGKIHKHLEDLLNSEIGKTIIEADLKRLEELYPKVIAYTAYKSSHFWDRLFFKKEVELTSSELAEFRYLRDKRIPWIISEFRQYAGMINQINKQATK